MGNQWVTVARAAAIFSVKERTIYRWVKDGKIQSTKRGSRTYVAIDESLTPPITDDNMSELVERLKLEMKGKDKLIEHLEGEVDFLRSAHYASLSQIQQLLLEAVERDEEQKGKKKWWRFGSDKD